MPKCENCEYLRTEGYEYPESYCAIFGTYQGETVWNPVTAMHEYPGYAKMFTDGGCRYTKKVLAKRYEAIEEHQNKYYKSFADYGEYEAQRLKEEKQLREDLASGKKYSFDREEEIKCPWCGEALPWTHYHERWTLQKCQSKTCGKWFSVEIKQLYSTARTQPIGNPEHPEYKKGEK